jgi:hypothetical protein
LEDVNNKRLRLASPPISTPSSTGKSAESRGGEDFAACYMQSQKVKLELQTKIHDTQTNMRREELDIETRARDREVSVKEKEVQIREKEVEMREKECNAKILLDEKKIKGELMMQLLKDGKSKDEIREFLDML